VLRKNSVGARKTMEMLSLTFLVSSLRDRRNPAAKAGPITTFLVKIASPLTWVCAILNHVSSRPLGVALARPCRSFRW
jgi:hypothetical protein